MKKSVRIWSKKVVFSAFSTIRICNDFPFKNHFFMVRSSPTCKKTSFSNSASVFHYKNAVISLFDDFVKKVKNSYFFTIFRIFFDQKHSKTFLKQQKSPKLDKGFQMVYKLSCFYKKILWSIFYIREDPYQKKTKKSNIPDEFIHQIYDSNIHEDFRIICH